MLNIHCPRFLGSIESVKTHCELIIKASPKACGEYELIKAVEGHGLFDFLLADEAEPDNKGLNKKKTNSPMLYLFYKHFITMHSLYGLQRKLYSDGFLLSISPLAIYIEPVGKESVNSEGPSCLQLSGFNQALSDYYGDLNHLLGATEDTVVDLIGQFWKRFNAEDGAVEACNILGVELTDEWPLVQSTYRKKIAIAHPDKGGSPEDFIKIKEAFDLLKRRAGQ